MSQLPFQANFMTKTNAFLMFPTIIAPPTVRSTPHFTLHLRITSSLVKSDILLNNITLD